VDYVYRSSDGTKFRVKVKLDNSIYPIHSGMSGQARIITARVSVLSYLLGLAEDVELEELRKKADEIGSATFPPGTEDAPFTPSAE